MSSGKKRQLSGDSERVSTQDGGAHDTTSKTAGDKTLKAAKRSRRVTVSTETGDTTSDKQESKGAVVKVKRQAWTATAIAAFFEGLCEHGKDFGRILQFMKNKHRKKQDPFVSNLMRNQVRFFYYRTWHKVSTLLNISGKQTRQAAPPTSNLTGDAEVKKDLEEEVVEMLGSPPTSTLTGDAEVKKDLEEEAVETLNSPPASTITGDAEVKKDVDEEAVEMLSSPLPPQEEPGIQGHPHTLSEEETEGEGEGDIAFDISLDEGEDPSAGERNLLGHDEEVVSENSNGPRSHNDYCDSLCQKEQSSAHFGFGPKTTNATSTTASTTCSTTTDIASAAATLTTAATSTSVTMTISAAGSGGKADSVSVSEGGAIGGKGKERHHQEGQGRDSGSMVMVHGAMHSLDLVALICYSKIKMKLTGDKQILAKKLHQLIYTGTTTIRMKGKRKIQLKIPNCPALRGNKALNPAPASSAAEPHGTCSASDSEVAGGADQRKSLVIELFPFNSHSWAYVQQLSMNPRIRLTVPPSRKVSDVVHVVASRWKLINHDEPASDVLKLYCQSLLPSPHMDITVPGCAAVCSTKDLQAGCQTHTGDVPATDQEPACRDGIDCASRIDQPTADCPNPSNLTCDPLPSSAAAVAPDGPQPLQLSGITIGELHEQTNKDKSSLKLGLLYEIKQNQNHSEECNRLQLLLQLAEFVAKDSAKLSTAGFATPSPCTPIGPITPNSHSSPVVLSSPAVTEYMRSLPKKSPLKSPLSKYRKMKRLRQSPLKTPSPLARPKPVRLQFDLQPSVHHSPVQEVGMSDALPPIAMNVSSPLASGASVPLHADGLASVPSVGALQPLLNAAPQSEVFSIAKHNADRKKQKPKKQKVHLVTVSKKALKNSGSFSRLRLNDLFKTVNENLKDVAASEDGGGVAGEVLPEDPLVPVVPAAVERSPSVTPQEGSSPLLMLQKQQREARAPHIVTQVSCPGSPQVSLAMSQNTPSSSTAQRPSTVTVTVLPSISTIGSSPVAVSTSAQAVPSPLEKLASTVATSSSLAQWATPVSSASTSSHIAVRPLTISSSLPNAASGVHQPAPSLSAIKALTKPSRRQTKPRSAKNMPPPSQRPVVPKPLLYLPQMAQVKSSLGQHTDGSTLGSSQHFMTGSSTELGGIASTSVLKNLGTTPNRVAPPGSINHQTVQSQLISLLQSMLQQQLSRQRQEQAQPRPVPLSSEMRPTLTQSVAQPVLKAVPMGGSHHPASNLLLPTSASSSAQLTASSTAQFAASSVASFSGTDSYHPAAMPEPCLPEQAVMQSSSDTVNELLRGLATSSPDQDQALRKLSEETSDVLPTFAKAMMQLEAISSSNSQGYPPGGSAVEEDGPQAMEEAPEMDDPVGASSGGQRDSSGSSDSLLAFLQGEGCEMGSISDSNLRQLVEQVDFSDAFSQLKDILKTPERPKESVHIRSTSRDASMAENLSHGPPLLDHDNSLCSLLDLLSSPLKGRNSIEVQQHPSSRNIGAASLPDVAGITAIHEQGTDAASIRHIFEENSVDYISKFRELASAMNRSSS